MSKGFSYIIVWTITDYISLIWKCIAKRSTVCDVPLKLGEATQQFMGIMNI